MGEAACIAVGGTWAFVACNTINCNLAAPYVVEISTVFEGNIDSKMFRRWSDGAIDLWEIQAIGPGNVNTEWWGWVDLIPVQRADMNADGCVGIQDFLVLLGDWDCES